MLLPPTFFLGPALAPQFFHSRVATGNSETFDARTVSRKFRPTPFSIVVSFNLQREVYLKQASAFKLTVLSANPTNSVFCV